MILIFTNWELLGVISKCLSTQIYQQLGSCWHLKVKVGRQQKVSLILLLQCATPAA